MLMNYLFYFQLVYSCCGCLMRQPSQGTKPYQAHYLSVYMYSSAGLIRRTPPPTFSDTVITNRQSGSTFSSPEHTGCGYPGLLDRKNRSDMCCRWEFGESSTSCVTGFFIFKSLEAAFYIGATGASQL